jgi:hypothetical protein
MLNTRSARQYAVFGTAQLWRNWREQRPSNHGDLDPSITGDVGRGCYTKAGFLVISVF